jgi:hypothetical protein
MVDEAILHQKEEGIEGRGDGRNREKSRDKSKAVDVNLIRKEAIFFGLVMCKNHTIKSA